ncbi:MAG: DarT ssDNA thymidine ADP-ribosyltransferase family protein [Bacteroidetes bacterium]|nr:DarT ssDNA thymidine ADP-ribosyltransferase family protein [Bacteroidota bacterium]
MTKIEQECQRRGITRLCHFTQSRNLAHILGDSQAILSNQHLQSLDLPYNPTDPNRWDDCEDMICCSLEFPNVDYFHRARKRDHLFKDWVILLIKPHYLWMDGTKFCPVNAATRKGFFIADGYKSFLGLFSQNTHGLAYNRSPQHLECAPTNIQAEVLVPHPIHLDSITSIVVADEEQAKREIRRAFLQGLSIDKNILVVPEFYKRSDLAQSIQQGNRVNESIFYKLNHD